MTAVVMTAVMPLVQGCPDDAPMQVEDAGALAGDAVDVFDLGSSTDAHDAGTADSGSVGSDAGGSASDAGAVEGPAAVARLAAAVCARQTECCPGNGGNCIQARTNSLRLRLEGPRITIDPAGLAMCEQTIADLACTDIAAYGGVVHVFTECAPFIVPTAAEGQACGGLFADDQCETGHCDNGLCVTPTTAQQGERCVSPDRPCAAGLGCGPIGECAPASSAGADCSTHGVCEESLVCVQTMMGGAHSCEQPRTLMIGELCEAGTICNFPCMCPVGDLGCAVGTCGDNSRCMP